MTSDMVAVASKCEESLCPTKCGKRWPNVPTTSFPTSKLCQRK